MNGQEKREAAPEKSMRASVWIAQGSAVYKVQPASVNGGLRRFLLLCCGISSPLLPQGKGLLFAWNGASSHAAFQHGTTDGSRLWIPMRSIRLFTIQILVCFWPFIVLFIFCSIALATTGQCKRSFSWPDCLLSWQSARMKQNFILKGKHFSLCNIL